MVWSPKYTVSDALVATIRQIGEVLGEMRVRRPKGNALATLRHSALELSTFASTSIEGNPLRLTDVKRLLKDSPQQARDTEREILNYTEALDALRRKIRSGTFVTRISKRA